MKPSDPTSDTMLQSPDDTLPDTELAPSASGEARAPAALASYQLGEIIGSGGMGEVVLARDRQIGRDVAIKRLRTQAPSASTVERFLREARIQARLDHPAIVPVYQLGQDSAGNPFFAMKRLAGVTLAEVLAGSAPPRQRLLRAFADVCLAVEFAHARAIVHRDLKPANIILGDYGEVYVLDWGLARVLDGEVESLSGETPSLDGRTEVGTMLGTPGYMAPEQVQSASEVGRPTDVYALGSILFEILAGEPLHPRGEGAIASTVVGTDGSPSRRRPDRNVPPELDALCIAALTTDPAVRPAAAELAERVQQYLDGDRDLERRRAVAAEQLALARAALAGGERSDAMRAAGRALALDPESQGAAELVSALLLEPPAVPPPELQAAIRDSDASQVERHAQGSVRGFLAVLALTPLVIWNGVVSWGVVGSVFGIALVLAITAWLIARSPGRGLREMVVYIFGVGALMAILGRLCSPFLFVPAIASLAAMAAATFPVFVTRPWVVVAVVAGGWSTPLVVEQLGMLRPTWSLHDGVYALTSHAMRLDGTPTIALTVIITIATIAVAGLHGGRIGRTHQTDRHKLVAQAWHLRQLLPR